MDTLRTTTDADKVLTVWLDAPGKGVNTISPLVLEELSQALSTIERERPAGVIFASAKPRGFVAGADLFEIRKMDREQIGKFLQAGQEVFERIARFPMPTVAAINGDCLGGGLELALACTYRVASADPSTNIGLPEVKLGIVPGWGGTVRLPRTIGLTRALPLLLAGKTMPPKKALRAGIVDEVVRPEALLAAARRRVLTPKPESHVSVTDRAAAKIPFLRNKVFASARAETERATQGHYPAPLRLIEVVRTGYEKGREAQFEAERAALTDLMQTETCRNLLRLFFLRQGAKKWIGEQVHARPAEIKHAAVIGGGTMGAGIVHALVRAGIPVRLVEVSAQAAAAGLGRVRKMLDDDLAAGRVDKLAARDAMNRVSPTIEWNGLGLADLVVEAVVEQMDAKLEVFARLDRLTRPDAVLASNTSSLSITRMAAATAHPGRVVGLHFFNPVPKMPLVEVVRTDMSDEQALATAAALAAKIGKTPILVRDAPGFLVNRVLIPYLAEALAAAAEGSMNVAQIDRALRAWGMPMGPFELLDQIGLDVAVHVLQSLDGTLASAPPLPAGVRTALARGWLGKKSGRGFYMYAKETKKRGRSAELEVNPEMEALLTGRPGAAPATAEPAGEASTAASGDESIQWRLVLPMVNEAARLLSEHVTDSTDAIDLATVLGLGLAPFRGGLIRFADWVGTADVVKRLDTLAALHGPRFVPAPLLRELASANAPLSAVRPGASDSPSNEPSPETAPTVREEPVVHSPQS